jgi:putative ABC transport system permease protein
VSPLLLALLASIPFVLVLLVEPVLRRTAWRNAVLRPREAILVAIGSLLGAAIITGSFVIGDTFDNSLTRRVYRELGTVDEVVAFPDRATWDEGRTRLAQLPTPPFDGAVAIGILATPMSAIADQPKSAPEAQMIEVDFAAAAVLGPSSISGIQGSTPGEGEAAITAQAATRLGVKAGDEVRVYAYGDEIDFKVVRVLPQAGLAGLRLSDAVVADNLLVAPGTVQRLAEQAEGSATFELAQPRWAVAVSNVGGVEDGADQTDAAISGLRRELQGVDAEIIAAKRDGLNSAVAGGEFLGQYLNAVGAFGVLAGVLLLINVFVMMGEERLPDLGSMRAVGMNRGAVVAAFSTEGWIYSFTGCLIGAFAGLGLGRVMVALVSGLYPAEDESFGMSMQFAARSSSPQKGFAYGLVISIIAVFLTSLRISRLDVIRALRNLPENRRRERVPVAILGLGAVTVGLGALITMLGFAWQGEVTTTLGPVLIMFGLVPLLRRIASTRTLVSFAALGAVLWAVVGRVILGPTPDSPTAMISQGLLMVASGVTLVTLQQHQLGRLLRRVGSGRRGVTARMALAYPLARPTRTALTLAPFTLVLFTLAFVASLSTLFTADLKTVDKRAGGGYDAVVSSAPANPVPFDELAKRDGVRAVAPLATTRVAFVAAESGHPLLTSVTGFDVSLLQDGRAPELFDRGPYATDEAAYRAVMADPDLVIVDPSFLDQYSGSEKIGPMVVGRSMSIVDPASAEARQVQIAAVANADIAFNGALYGKRSLEALVGGRAVTNRAYVAVDDPEAFIADFEGRYIPNGAKVHTFERLGDDILETVSQIVNVYWTYLGVGLVVGVAGVAVMMVRAVRERRRQIGLLRSLGFEAGMVGRSFLLEASFVAFSAVVLGIGLAVATVFSVVHSPELREFIGIQPHFTLATGTLAALAAVTILAALLATAGPARTASRIPPSEALRLID